jgi:hypothetical protein
MRAVAIAGARINQGLGSWGANSAIRGAISLGDRRFVPDVDV